MQNLIRIAIALATSSILAGPAMSQSYPSRPITMIVPFAAGGPLDVMGRILAERMRAPLGQPVIIEAVAGAAGSIGVGRAVRAAPDGYTIVLGTWGTHVGNGAIYSLPYDLLGDLEPIINTSTTAQIIVGRKSLPADDLKGLIAWLKANPHKATEGTAGIGSPAHIAGAYFQKMTGTTFQFVPFRGLGPAMQAMLADQIDFMIDVLVNSQPHIQAGTIKAFAVAGKERLRGQPNIPTSDEAGLPGFHAPNWYGVWAPKGTPEEIVAKLNAALVETMADPAVRQRLNAMGQEIAAREQQTPAALAALHKAEIEKWWPIIKAAGSQAQ
jgi:tripartite-type tricarboxylate transporter receptor subunit TctC